MKPASPRPPRRAVHGVLLLDKPRGWTSNDALQKAKGMLRALKAGHTGTLDPLATGLLPLCFGAATKYGQVALDADKRYVATLKLGQRSTTFDGEGELSPGSPACFDDHALRAACEALSGEIEQLAPMHSAVKKDGKALYLYARAGQEVAREPRRVRIHRLEVLARDADRLVLDVQCSKGTYIRTLASDMGEKLGCGAWLQTLRRTACGPLDIADAITLEALAELDEAGRDARLLPPDSLLQGWPQQLLAPDEAARFLAGARRPTQAADQPFVRVYGPDGFLGSAHIRGGELIADRLLSPLEVGAMRA